MCPINTKVYRLNPQPAWEWGCRLPQDRPGVFQKSLKSLTDQSRGVKVCYAQSKYMKERLTDAAMD